MPVLALVHTVASLVPVFESLRREIAPDVESFNIVDESLLQTTIRTGELTPLTTRRLAGYVASAEEAGADAVLVTCSSVGAAAEAARPLVDIPVLRVDEPMVDEAIAIASGEGGSVGVLATLRTTLEPTADLLRRRAEGGGGDAVDAVARVVEGAFEALRAGDAERHDTLVRDALRSLASEVDVVVLAQASMARVLDERTVDEIGVPVLSSPRFGLARAADVVRNAVRAARAGQATPRATPALGVASSVRS